MKEKIDREENTDAWRKVDESGRFSWKKEMMMMMFLLKKKGR